MNQANRNVIDAAVNLLSYALTGDNGDGLWIDTAWDGACVTIHISTALCDHPPGDQRRVGLRTCNGIEGPCMLEAGHTGNHATRVAPLTGGGNR